MAAEKRRGRPTSARAGAGPKKPSPKKPMPCKRRRQGVAKKVSPQSSPLAAAEAYLECGWSPIPVPHKKKAPKLQGWQKLLLTKEKLHEHFRTSTQNVGVLLGEPSGGLIDIDLDCPEAVLLAPYFLPETLTFGRPGNPSSHWLYCVKRPPDTQRFHDPGGSTLVELRSTGGQTVFPPSVHPSGERIAFVSNGPPPAEAN